MAYALLDSTIRRAWAKSAGKLEGDLRLCQTCGQKAIFLLTDLPGYEMGDHIRVTCNQHHTPVDKSIRVLISDNIAQRYTARFETAKAMVQEWNDKQEEIRNLQMFPGKPHAQG
jgi:hypothetical protein